MLCIPRSFQNSQKNAVLVPVAAVGVGGMLVYWLMSRRKIKSIEMGDGWWGSGEKPLKGKEDESIRPFKIETSDEEIEVEFDSGSAGNGAKWEGVGTEVGRTAGLRGSYRRTPGRVRRVFLMNCSTCP